MPAAFWWAVVALMIVVMVSAAFLGGRAAVRSDQLEHELEGDDQADDDYATELGSIPAVPAHELDLQTMELAQEVQLELEPLPLVISDLYRFHPHLEQRHDSPAAPEEDGWVQLGDRAWLPPAALLAGRPPGDALANLLWHAALMKVEA
jgi:hypothetical protein